MMDRGKDTQPGVISPMQQVHLQAPDNTIIMFNSLSVSQRFVLHSLSTSEKHLQIKALIVVRLLFAVENIGETLNESQSLLHFHHIHSV